jgi:DNA-binding NtrC family response regulator
MVDLDGRPTILIVEDDNLIRMETVDAFEDAGFTVIEAWNGVIAIELIERHPEIQVVFTDIEMPGGVNGIELMRIVERRWPDISVMICSGPINLAVKKLYRHIPFFSKPYDTGRASTIARDMIS